VVTVFRGDSRRFFPRYGVCYFYFSLFIYLFLFFASLFQALGQQWGRWKKRVRDERDLVKKNRARFLDRPY